MDGRGSQGEWTQRPRKGRIVKNQSGATVAIRQLTTKKGKKRDSQEKPWDRKHIA